MDELYVSVLVLVRTKGFSGVHMLLIGSRALQRVFPGLLNREPRDYDFIARYDEVEAWAKLYKPRIRAIYPTDGGKKIIARTGDKTSSENIYEFEIAWSGSTGAELLDVLNKRPHIENTVDNIVYTTATLDALYCLKLSHRFLRNSPHFLKTRADILQMQSTGVTIPIDLTAWYQRREAETYNYPHPNLSQSKAGFFSGDGVKYVYDHDSLHQAVKHYDVPVYKMIQREGSEVAVDHRLWDRLDLEHRLASVLEEAYVLALERSQIPFPGKLSPRRSFEVALMKICTSIASGWYREFAWNNYDAVMDRYVEDGAGHYMNKFEMARLSGVVKLAS